MPSCPFKLSPHAYTSPEAILQLHVMFYNKLKYVDTCECESVVSPTAYHAYFNVSETLLIEYSVSNYFAKYTGI